MLLLLLSRFSRVRLVQLLLLKFITKICKNSGRTKLICGIMENGEYVIGLKCFL